MTEINAAAIVEQANQLYEQGRHAESFELYSKAADMGDTFSLCRVGQMYAEGDGIVKDAVKAFEFFKRSSVDGNTDAVFELGRCYFDGIGTEVDQEKGYELVLSSAKKGHAPAQNYIGALYANGEHVEVDEDIAFEWFMKSADQGFPKALYNAASFYHREKFRDEAKELDCLRRSAEKGYPDALYVVAMRIIDGADEGGSIDDAIGYLTSAADKGNIRACDKLGSIYYWGNYTEKDYVKAEKYLLVAAEAGISDAMHLLGCTYYYSKTELHDYKKSIKWLQMAADRGNARSMGLLGEMYYWGQGVKADEGLAFKFFKKSAKGGVSYAMYWLGRMYRERRGSLKDEDKAIKWLMKASGAGVYEADYQIGLMNLDGAVTGHKDIDLAVTGFRMAADSDYAPAMYELGRYYEHCDKEKSSKDAIYWYKKAAANKYIPAMLALADHYRSGSFIPLSYEKAYSIYQECYNQEKDPRAASNLGYMNESGLGRDIDIAEAKKWYEIAAKAKNGFSMYRLGVIYQREGRNEESVYWIRRAAGAGVREAMMGLADSYEKGDDLPQSYKLAAEWYHRAADEGCEEAKAKFESLFEHIDDADDEEPTERLRRLAGERRDTDAMLKLADMSEDDGSKRMWLGFAADLRNKRAKVLLREMDRIAEI